MLAKNMYDFRDDLVERGIIFCYSGYVTEEILSGIANALRTKLELDEADRKTAKSLFSVFVEQVQNIVRYSAEREPSEADDDEPKELRYGVLTVGRKDGKYFVSCANMIQDTDVQRLRDSLEHIQGLDRKALMDLYKKTLKGGPPEGSKGAGVGFIDIARQAKHGFDFDFLDIEGNLSYFCLKAYL